MLLDLEPQVQLRYHAIIEQGRRDLAKIGVPEVWSKLAADWHRANWLEVEDFREAIRTRSVLVQETLWLTSYLPSPSRASRMSLRSS